MGAYFNYPDRYAVNNPAYLEELLDVEVVECKKWRFIVGSLRVFLIEQRL